MGRHELAQLNIAVMKEPLESPSMADFVANLDRINALAEAAPGFVWRLQTDDGDATALRPLGDNTLVNMSVWRDSESLSRYVYQSAHVEVMRRRREWFERHRPSIDEALGRLALLRQHGPSREAFNFGTAFPPPDARAGAPFVSGSECPAA
jgi:hypothetical protein